MLEEVINANDVDFVIQYDVHAYERLNPIRFGGTQTNPVQVESDENGNYHNPGGPVYLICGNAGQKSQTVGSYGNTNYNPATVVTSMDRGFCDLTFSRNRVEYSYVSTETAGGQIIDEFVLTKTNKRKLKKCIQ